MEKKYTQGKIILVLLCIFIFLAIIVTYEVFIKTDRQDPIISTEQKDDIFITESTPVRQEIYYTQCHHLIKEESASKTEFIGKDYAQLQKENWHGFRAEGGQVVLFQEKDLLCPQDSEKRHLALHENNLAIFAGPANCQGPLIEVLGIDPANLDEKWQEQLKNGGIDFPNQEELLTVLENLDEY